MTGRAAALTGAIVALATFFKANMAVNSVPCPTVRRITGIKLNGDYDTDNWWGIAVRK